MRLCITPNDASTHHFAQMFFHNARMHDVTRINIRALLNQADLSERGLALACKMSQTTLNRFLRGDTDSLDYANLKMIANYFELTVSELTGETARQEDSKVRVVVAAMAQMPEYKKDMLVAASSTLAEPEKHRSNGTND